MGVFTIDASLFELPSIVHYCCKVFLEQVYERRLISLVIGASVLTWLRVGFFFCMLWQYIQPHEHEKLSQVELLVVDEAAAIPLPVVKSLLGPYLVFLSSTVNGYDAIRLIFVSLLLKYFMEH